MQYTYEHIIVRIVESVEDLGLHRVKLGESLTVEIFILLVPEKLGLI